MPVAVAGTDHWGMDEWADGGWLGGLMDRWMGVIRKQMAG